MPRLQTVLRNIRPSVRIGDHKIIKYSYGSVLTAAARLSQFAAMKPPFSRGSIYYHQSCLAINDLIDFATHARRFIAHTVTLKNVESIRIQLNDSTKEPAIAVITIINIITENTNINLCRTLQEFNIMKSTFDSEDFIIRGSEYLKSPISFVTRENEDIFSFQLEKLVDSFEVQILEPIVDFCQEDGLYLNNLYD